MTSLRFFAALLLLGILSGCQEPVAKHVDNTPHAVFLAYFHAVANGDAATLISLWPFSGMDKNQINQKKKAIEKGISSMADFYEEKDGIKTIQIKQKLQLAEDVYHISGQLDYNNGEHQRVSAYIGKEGQRWKLLSCIKSRPICSVIDFFDKLGSHSLHQMTTQLDLLVAGNELAQQLTAFNKLRNTLDRLEKDHGVLSETAIKTITTKDTLHKEVLALLIFANEKAVAVQVHLLYQQARWKVDGLPVLGADTTANKNPL